MKTKCVIALAFLALSPFSYANNDDKHLQSLLDFKEVRTVKLSSEETERLRILRAKAHTVGLQSGAYYASNKIRERLDKMSVKLDAIYDFSRLGVVRPYKGAFVVNPVISEMEKTIALSPDSRSFIVRDQTFVITKDPFMALTAPSWRSYLTFNVEPPQIPDDMLKPKTPEEISAWREEMLIGYEIGINQAVEVTVMRFARLTRDIVGMQRFDLLRQRKVVSDIRIADAYYPVSGGGNRMNINESRVSIEINPQLNTNRWDWEIIPRLADVSDLFPNGAMVNDWVTIDAK